MAENFLNRLARNPYAPIDAASVTRIDEMGNGLDDWGNIIAQAPQQPQAQSWGELGYGIATAPMRFGNALAQSVNPYKGNEHPITQPDASSWQVPPLLSESWDAINSFGNAYHNGMSEDDMRRNANIAAGLTMGGGGLAARPMEVLASNASKEASVPAQASALDMSPEARLARARDMGFDTDRVLYHGTGKTFDEFNPGTRGNGTQRNIYLTDNPDIADIYANSKNYGLKGGGDPQIYPVFAKSEKPLVVSDKGPDGSFGWVSDNLSAALGLERPPAGRYSSLYDEARRQGYDQVQIRDMTDLGGPQTQYIPLKPEYIRSVNAAFDPSKSDSANLLAANADSRASLPALASGVGDRQGITAYHGSPHDFDRFDLSKIGTGEGAQAYGHGLYFAENEGVARSYRDRLGDYTGAVQWKGKQPPTPLQQRLMSMMGGADVRSGRAMTVDMLKREIGRMIVDAEHGMFPDAKRAAKYRSEYDELERIAPLIETKPPGHMYQVRINANPEYFLDWDKPFSEQPVKVQEAVANHPAFIPPLSYNPDNFMRNAMRDPETTALLKEAGLPGIRYLDKMSRDAGDGTSNYVVFDDSLIEILKKYGWVPPAAYGANALSQSQDNQY